MVKQPREKEPFETGSESEIAFRQKNSKISVFEGFKCELIKKDCQGSFLFIVNNCVMCS